MSEGVRNCFLTSKWAMLSAISWWVYDIICFVLDQHCSLIFWVQAHWNNNPQIDMSLNLDILSCLRPNSSLFLSREATNTSFIVFALTWKGLNARSTTLKVNIFFKFFLEHNYDPEVIFGAFICYCRVQWNIMKNINFIIFG